MDKPKDTFIMYGSWWENIMSEYTEDEAKELIFAIVKYGFTGEKTYPRERLFLKQTYSQLDQAGDRWKKISEARSAAGKAGTGESKARFGNKNASKKTETQQNATNHNKTQLSERESERTSNSVRESERERESVSESESVYSSCACLNGSAEEKKSWLDDEEGEWV